MDVRGEFFVQRRFRGDAVGGRQDHGGDKGGGAEHECRDTEGERVAVVESGGIDAGTGAARGDGGERGDADAAAELSGAVEHARCHARLLSRNAHGRRRGDRSQAQSEAEAADQRGAEHVGDEAAIGTDQREPADARGSEQAAADECGLR